MNFARIHSNFYNQFNYRAVFGVEFEFIIKNNNDLSTIKKILQNYSDIELKKEKHERQYELVFMHTTEIDKLISKFNEIKNKILQFIDYFDIKKKFLEGCMFI